MKVQPLLTLRRYDESKNEQEVSQPIHPLLAGSLARSRGHQLPHQPKSNSELFIPSPLHFSPSEIPLLIHSFIHSLIMSAQRNILAVIGTTGVGKSAYAISLARSPVLSTSQIRPAVLSSDSMQLYEGLPVITNKVTEEEMAGVDHWGLGFVKPGVEGSWEVGKWCLEAWEKVSCGFCGFALRCQEHWDDFGAVLGWWKSVRRIVDRMWARGVAGGSGDCEARLKFQRLADRERRLRALK
jgi:hypothetical protein